MQRRHRPRLSVCLSRTRWPHASPPKHDPSRGLSRTGRSASSPTCQNSLPENPSPAASRTSGTGNQLTPVRIVDATPNSGVLLLLLESGSRRNRYFHLNVHRIKYRRFTRTHLELDSRCSCALTVRRSDPAYNYIVWACTAVARTTRRPACASTRHTRFQAPSCTLLSMVSHLLSALGLFSNFVLEKTNLV